MFLCSIFFVNLLHYVLRAVIHTTLYVKIFNIYMMCLGRSGEMCMVGNDIARCHF